MNVRPAKLQFCTVLHLMNGHVHFLFPDEVACLNAFKTTALSCLQLSENCCAYTQKLSADTITSHLTETVKQHIVLVSKFLQIWEAKELTSPSDSDEIDSEENRIKRALCQARRDTYAVLIPPVKRILVKNEGN